MTVRSCLPGCPTGSSTRALSSWRRPVLTSDRERLDPGLAQDAFSSGLGLWLSTPRTSLDLEQRLLGTDHQPFGEPVDLAAQPPLGQPRALQRGKRTELQ